MKAFSFSERGWRRYDTKKETNMPMRMCERYDQTTTSRKGWSIVPSQMQKTTFHMILRFDVCFEAINYRYDNWPSLHCYIHVGPTIQWISL